MLYDRTKYVGREIQLFPEDSTSKYGIIEDVDDVGFWVRITKVGNANYRHNYNVGDLRFYNHGHSICFKILD